MMANDLETYQGRCIKENQTSGVHDLRYLHRWFAPRWTILMNRSKPGGTLKPWLEVTTNAGPTSSTLASMLKSSMYGLAVSPFYIVTNSLNISVRSHAATLQTFTTRSTSVTLNKSNSANPLHLLTSKKDCNSVTTKPSVISSRRQRQRAAIDN
jgi:hypothetical protein